MAVSSRETIIAVKFVGEPLFRPREQQSNILSLPARAVFPIVAIDNTIPLLPISRGIAASLE